MLKAKHCIYLFSCILMYFYVFNNNKENTAQLNHINLQNELNEKLNVYAGETLN